MRKEPPNNARSSQKSTPFPKLLLKNFLKAIAHKETEKETSEESKNFFKKKNKNSLLNAPLSLEF